MNAIRAGAVVPLCLLAFGCAAQSPVAPAARETGGASVTPQTTTQCVAQFPTPTKPARIYVATGCLSYSSHASPVASRYVLYDDGTFGLQYSSVSYPFFEYRGTYHQNAGGHVSFNWEGWSAAGPWGATGELTEELLTVEYNLIMQLSDFVDGVFVRER